MPADIYGFGPGGEVHESVVKAELPYRLNQTIRVVGGPFGGTTFKIRHEHMPIRFLRTGKNRGLIISDLVWIAHGADRHCHQIVVRYRFCYLQYRDTF